MKHAFRFHPKTQFKIVGGEIFVIISKIIGGIGVIGASVTRDDTEPFSFWNVFGTLKQKVFEEMSKTRSFRVFIFGTYMIEYRGCDYRN